MHWNHLHLIVTIHTIEDFVHAFVLTWIKSVTKSEWTVYQQWTGTTHFHRTSYTLHCIFKNQPDVRKSKTMQLWFWFCSWNGTIYNYNRFRCVSDRDKKSFCATAMTWIALLPLSYCWHASMALSKRFDRSTTISETSNGRFDRSFTITINMEPDMAASHIPFQLVPKLQ